jgi:integrase/recombinase XerD
MNYELIYRVDLGSAQSPFRVVAQPTGREVDWINRFLDQCSVRGLAWHTLRGYAFDLTHFVRWWADRHSTDEVTEQALTSSSLLDYLRYQAGRQPRPAASTINTRLWVAERALRCQFPEAVPPTAPGFQQFYWRQSKLGYGRWRPALTRLRVKVPKRVVTPLSIDEVSRFWSSFRTCRDLAIVGLMLLQGLRSCEVLALDQEDLILSEAQIRVCGKGNKVRLLPLAPEAVQLLEHYLRLERPLHCGAALFVSLKGRARGTRMTAAGLRSLFRHHRQITGVAKANPHRFRHYLPFLTMSGNRASPRGLGPKAVFLSCKASQITRHSPEPVTDCSGRRGVDHQVYSGRAVHAAGMSWPVLSPSWPVSLRDRFASFQHVRDPATKRSRNGRRPLGEDPWPWCVSSGGQ